jgi:hypothetical protein
MELEEQLKQLLAEAAEPQVEREKEETELSSWSPVPFGKWPAPKAANDVQAPWKGRVA